MTTWISKGAIAALALTVLAACENGQGGSLLGALGTPSDDKPVALSQAKMAFGAVTLVAPRGFCIDSASLRQNFALMARCDVLGAPSAAADAPVGLITASFSGGAVSIPTPADTASAQGLASVAEAQETENSVTFRANGTPPVEGMAKDHWRGTARVGNQLVGLALYGPSGGQATGPQGRDVLNRLIKATNAGS